MYPINILSPCNLTTALLILLTILIIWGIDDWLNNLRKTRQLERYFKELQAPQNHTQNKTTINKRNNP